MSLCKVQRWHFLPQVVSSLVAKRSPTIAKRNAAYRISYTTHGRQPSLHDVLSPLDVVINSHFNFRYQPKLNWNLLLGIKANRRRWRQRYRRMQFCSILSPRSGGWWLRWLVVSRRRQRFWRRHICSTKEISLGASWQWRVFCPKSLAPQVLTCKSTWLSVLYVSNEDKPQENNVLFFCL